MGENSKVLQEYYRLTSLTDFKSACVCNGGSKKYIGDGYVASQLLCSSFDRST